MPSVACSRPMTPGTTPSTPATEQPGASSGGGGVGIEAAVAGALVGHEDRQLALEAEDGGVHDRDARAHGGVVERVARLEGVRAVEDEVVARDEAVDVVRRRASPRGPRR